MLTPLIFEFAILSATYGLSPWRSGLVPITHWLVGPIIIVSSPHLLYIYILVVWICLVDFIVSVLIPPIMLLYLCCSSSGSVLVLCLYGSYFALPGVLALVSIIIDMLWLHFKSIHNYVTRDVYLISSSVILFLSFLPWYSLSSLTLPDILHIIFSLVDSYCNWYHPSLNSWKGKKGTETVIV